MGTDINGDIKEWNHADTYFMGKMDAMMEFGEAFEAELDTYEGPFKGLINRIYLVAHSSYVERIQREHGDPVREQQRDIEAAIAFEKEYKSWTAKTK